jgi:hypothetical protein
MIRMQRLTGGVALALALAAAAPAAQTPKVAPAAKPAPAPQKAAPADPDSRDINLRAYVELLRSDVRSQKVAILSEMMGFTEEEDAKFWPIYRDYDGELSKINDGRVTLIEDYAKNYEQMTDAAADRIALGAIELEGRRHALKQKYYDRLKATLSPKMAARFLQVENQLLMIIDLQISAALPVVK